jgi:protein gp37
MTLKRGWAGWGDKSQRVRSKGFWEMARNLNRKAEGAAERPRMFPSLMDWLDPQAPVEWLGEFLDLIRQTPNLDWLLLTKRIDLWAHRMVEIMRVDVLGADIAMRCLDAQSEGKFYLENVWIGVSVEDQKRADERREAFKAIPAAVKFVSYEPALSSIDWTGWDFVHWIIYGGESGPKRRPSEPEWVTGCWKFCWRNGIKFYCKQDGGERPGMKGRLPDAIWNMKEFPAVLGMQ